MPKAIPWHQVAIIGSSAAHGHVAASIEVEELARTNSGGRD
jgi:hypothetical protein